MVTILTGHGNLQTAINAVKLDREHGKGKWLSLPAYMSKKAKIDVSHGYCPECFKEAEKMIEKQKE